VTPRVVMVTPRVVMVTPRVVMVTPRVVMTRFRWSGCQTPKIKFVWCSIYLFYNVRNCLNFLEWYNFIQILLAKNSIF
jgi:hypothetical protein